MLLRNNSSVNDGEFSNFMTFDNERLFNVTLISDRLRSGVKYGSRHHGHPLR